MYMTDSRRPRKGLKRRLVPVVVAMGVPLVGCSYSNTQAAELACVYNGGPFDSKNFRQYKEPGAGRESVGAESTVIEVPLRLITYEISGEAGQGDTATPGYLTVNVGGMVMEFEPTVRMVFNTRFLEEENEKGEMVQVTGTEGGPKPTVCELVEVQLRPFDATDFNVVGGKWQTEFMASRIRPLVDVAGVRALQDAGNPVDVYFNSSPKNPDGSPGDGLGARDAAAVVLGRELKEELDAALNGEYFCGPSHSFGSEVCADIEVSLPQPKVNDTDLETLNAPRRASTEADARVAAAEQETRAQVAEANEEANRAAQVADARARVAASATAKADADALIAQQEARTIAVTTQNEYAWCQVLVNLGEPCWLVKAAETGNMPLVIGEIPAGVQVPVQTGN